MQARDYVFAALVLLVLLGALHVTDKIALGLQAKCDMSMPAGD